MFASKKGLITGKKPREAGAKRRRDGALNL
jgi:hypothetical protein